MLKILQATYNNGELILNEKLSEELEGKNLQITQLDRGRGISQVCLFSR
jgi:hypothetical protein